MQRKLVKQGPSTLTVSMPAKWVRDNALQPGDEVSVQIENNKIIVQADRKDTAGPSTTVDISSLDDTIIGLLLHALHKKGYEEARLTCKPSQIPRVEEVVTKKLLGFEIVEQTEGSVVVRFVTKIDADELGMLVRRSFLVTLSIAERVASQDVTEGEILALEATNNRLVNYGERIIYDTLADDKDRLFTYLIIWLLEKIADEYRDIIAVGKNNIDDAKTAHSLLKRFYEVYYKYSYQAHNEFLSELGEHTKKMIKRKSPYVHILTMLYQTGGSVIALQL